MKWYVNLKTATKLISAFVVTAILAGIMGFYGLSNMQTSNDSLNLLYSKNLLSVQYLNQATVNYSRMRIAMRDIALYKDVKDQNQRINDLQKMIVAVEDNMNSFRKAGNSPAKQAALQKN
jgi:methyl-accepting chemotaxis protein